ncbi:MAG: hypothetical protein JW976_15355, partial [Syntrophaceae bacterium]|nr:hypothetical protein [Syntrophaceae bacterium]
MNIDEFKGHIERHVKACIEELSKDNNFFDPTIKRYELRLNKGCETILLCNSAVIRVKCKKIERCLQFFGIKVLDQFFFGCQASDA